MRNMREVFITSASSSDKPFNNIINQIISIEKNEIYSIESHLLHMHNTKYHKGSAV